MAMGMGVGDSSLHGTCAHQSHSQLALVYLCQINRVNSHRRCCKFVIFMACIEALNVAQEVEGVREKVRIQSSNIGDIRKHVDSAENTVIHTDQLRRQSDDGAERLKQRLSTAEAKLERLTMERHCLLVYAAVVTGVIRLKSDHE